MRISLLAATLGIAGAMLGALPAAHAADVAAGAKAFAACRACHTLPAGGRNGVGPNLSGLFGRRAATVPGFNYSPALKASKIVWNDQQLDAYLAAPAKKVPGTRMFTRVADAKARAALIAYLKQETAK